MSFRNRGCCCSCTRGDNVAMRRLAELNSRLDDEYEEVVRDYHTRSSAALERLKAHNYKGVRTEAVVPRGLTGTPLKVKLFKITSEYLEVADSTRYYMSLDGKIYCVDPGEYDGNSWDIVDRTSILIEYVNHRHLNKVRHSRVKGSSPEFFASTRFHLRKFDLVYPDGGLAHELNAPSGGSYTRRPLWVRLLGR